jgi:hypothetical protein
MPEPPKDEGEVAIHTLLTREIRPIHNWHEWLAYWQATENLEWMESLLHVGFNVSLERSKYGEKVYDRVDRIIFYFTIADGWADDSLLELSTDKNEEYVVGRDAHGNTIRKKQRELRQQLARKAFDMLCPNLFKVELMGGGRHGDQFGEVWERDIVSERLFPVIQNFFRAEKDRYGDNRIRNLSHGWLCERSHSEQQAEIFLLNLAKFVWAWKEPDASFGYRGSDKEEEEIEKRFAEMRIRVDTAKPWMVEVLAKLNRLDALREWILELDAACLAKLKEIAFRTELSKGWRHPVAKYRPVATLDEACFVDSKAAWLIQEHALKTREYKRLTAIREAEWKREEAERSIKELTGKK